MCYVCDVSKAFDRVWIKGLLFKLKQNGVNGNVLKGIQRYLTGRIQKVFVVPSSDGKWHEYINNIIITFSKVLVMMRKKMFRNFYITSCIAFRNNFPEHIRISETLKLFKSQLISHCFNHSKVHCCYFTGSRFLSVIAFSLEKILQ